MLPPYLGNEYKLLTLNSEEPITSRHHIKQKKIRIAIIPISITGLPGSSPRPSNKNPKPIASKQSLISKLGITFNDSMGFMLNVPSFLSFLNKGIQSESSLLG